MLIRKYNTVAYSFERSEEATSDQEFYLLATLEIEKKEARPGKQLAELTEK